MIRPMATTPDRHVADHAIATVEQEFAVMFTRVKSAMRDRAARVDPGLQVLGYTILTALVRLGPMHASDLADALSLDKSIISRHAKLLEALDFLERQPDPDDHRAAYLAATPTAIERVTEVRLADQAMLYESLRDWELRDLDKLAELLGRLNELDA